MTRIQANTSRKPLATPLAMSTAQEDVEFSHGSQLPVASQPPDATEHHGSSLHTPLTRPNLALPQPRLMFETHDLTHKGATIFFDKVSPVKLLENAIETVLRILYAPYKGQLDHPPVRSITLVLEDMSEVAYTTGKYFDSEHKEIHFSLRYIAQISSQPSNRQREEIYGVLIHEMVHVWQHSASGVPGGLIEGIADFVRLRAGYSPPHWKRAVEPGQNWDSGYERTGYFLDWMEKQYGDGTIRRINLQLKGKKYDEKSFWEMAIGESIQHAWKRYLRELSLEQSSGGVALTKVP